MKKNILIIISGLLFIYSCGDIFERNLEKDKVKLLSPADNAVSPLQTPTFWWEEVKGATHYKVEIVSPSFASPQILVADTNVMNNILYYSLFPGKYQWRVRAENGSSHTAYTTFTLTVDTLSDISRERIFLTSPQNDAFRNSFNFLFEWQALFSASEYKLQIATPGFSGNPDFIADTVLYDNTFSYQFTKEGKYQWRVKGINPSGETAFSSPFNLVVDTTAPAPPVLTLPGNNAFLNPPIDFAWKRAEGAQLSPIAGDTLYIYSDSLSTLVAPGIFTGHSSYTFSDSLAPGDYFWRVKTADKAGNSSQFSTARKFFID